MTQKIKLKIKKGDEVIIIAGKDKGRKGVVQQVRRLANGGSKVLVEGVNLVKKHVKPNPNKNEQGGIKEMESFMAISNVMLYNPDSKKGDKVTYRLLEDGRKVRCFKSTDEVVSVDKVYVPIY